MCFDFLKAFQTDQLKSATHKQKPKTNNMKGRREKKQAPKHQNETDCKQPKPEKSTQRNGKDHNKSQGREGKG